VGFRWAGTRNKKKEDYQDFKDVPDCCLESWWIPCRLCSVKTEKI
jgi:hypothetical protein